MTSALQPDLLSRLSARYPTWLCDVWGVIHDGHKPIASAVAALKRHRAGGGKVILITNAPRPKATIQKHIDEIGVSRDAYDDMVTSGDATRELMLTHARLGLFHLGPAMDLALFEGLDVKRAGMHEASAVVCTGLVNDAHEKPEDYRALLQEMHVLGLPMICANPDKVVRRGRHLVPCAGALAEIYQELGGVVYMAGKSFAPIYELALARAGNPLREKVLAIGDGPETDIVGAQRNGLDCLFIAGGINESASAEADVRTKYPQAHIVGAMAELYWA